MTDNACATYNIILNQKLHQRDYLDMTESMYSRLLYGLFNTTTKLPVPVTQLSICLVKVLKMSTKKPRTARNGRFGFEDLCEIMPDILEFGIGAPSLNLMAKLKPYLVEATKQRMVSR